VCSDACLLGFMVILQSYDSCIKVLSEPGRTGTSSTVGPVEVEQAGL